MKEIIWLLLFMPSVSFAFCFQEAGQRYGIDAGLLKAIAQTESSMRPWIESRTQDIGLMGINRSWVPTLRRRFGLTEKDIWEPCTNVMVGAWILANNFASKGKNWNAVGMYNAACTKLQGADCLRVRQVYSQKVWKNWQTYQN
jgi:soluble lytic murein transglycosylase-like protein